MVGCALGSMLTAQAPLAAAFAATPRHLAAAFAATPPYLAAAFAAFLNSRTLMSESGLTMSATERNDPAWP